MRVLVVFEFPEIEAESDEAEHILADIGEACETMATGFDASACWIQDCIDDAPNDPAALGEIFADDPRDSIKSPTVVHKLD